MIRVLTAYRANPSPENAAKVQTHLSRHPMAVCVLSPEDIAYLRAHAFKL